MPEKHQKNRRDTIAASPRFLSVIRLLFFSIVSPGLRIPQSETVQLLLNSRSLSQILNPFF